MSYPGTTVDTSVARTVLRALPQAWRLVFHFPVFITETGKEEWVRNRAG